MSDNEKLDFLIDKVDLLLKDVGTLKDDVGMLKTDVRDLKEDNISLKHSMREMELTMENRLWPSIQRVAEGHLDLSRQLREALKPNQEFEMLSIRMTMLENEVQGMKQKLS